MISNRADDAPDNRRLWRLSIAAGLLAIPLFVLWWPGCRQYPAVTSRESLGLMKLLYTACNTKDPARLAKVEEGLGKSEQAGKLTEAERDAFHKIIGWAKAGEWERAGKGAFQFAEDQVGRGSSETQVREPHDPKSPKGTLKR